MLIGVFERKQSLEGPTVQIAERLAHMSAEKRHYILQSLPAHLSAGAMWGELEQLLTDLSFLEAKTEAGLVFDLVHDFGEAVQRIPPHRPQSRIVRLLEQALRQEVHFLARHPTTLFQCLWNVCWWYDSPQAAKHYGRQRRTLRTSSSERLPWSERGPKLYRLMQAWRRSKEQAHEPFLWLQSLLPPAVPLETPQRAIFRGHTGPVTGIACAPDGRSFVSCGVDGSVRQWDLVSGRELQGWTWGAHYVHSITFSPNGRDIAVGLNFDFGRLPPGAVVFLDIETGATPIAPHSVVGTVHSVAFSPNGRHIAVGLSSGRIPILETSSGKEIGCLDGHRGAVRQVRFSPDGERIASVYGERDSPSTDTEDLYSLDCSVRVWDWQRGQECWSTKGGTKGDDWHTFTSVAFSGDGSRVAVGLTVSQGVANNPFFPDRSNHIWILNAQDGSVLRCLKGHQSTRAIDIDSLIWSFDDQWLFSASNLSITEPATIRIWEANTGGLSRSLQGHNADITQIIPVPHSLQLLTASMDATIRLWDATNSQKICPRFSHQGAIRNVTFSHDGRLVASSSVDGRVCVWDLERDQPLVWEKLASSVNAVHFSPDNKALFIQWYSGLYIATWGETETTIKEVFRYDNASVVAYSPDYRRVAIGRWYPRHELDIIDLESGHRVSCQNVTQPMLDPVFSPNGLFLAARASLLGSNSLKRKIKIWNTYNGEAVAELFRHKKRVGALAFSPDNQLLASASDDGTIRLWSTSHWACVAQLRDPKAGGSISRVAFSVDSNLLVSTHHVHGDSSLTVEWDMQTYKLSAVHRGKADVTMMVNDSQAFPWRAFAEELETRVAWPELRAVLGWFPGRYTAAHPKVPMWVGFDGNNLFLYRLVVGKRSRE